jgi:hypothetical protein
VAKPYFEIFQWLACQHIDGVCGAVAFDTGLAGPTVGLTVMTHGNEPAGLAAVAYAYDIFLAGKLKGGRLICVLNNVLAAERYFADPTGSSIAYRLVDCNMNRLPKNVLSSSDLIDCYEYRRAEELAFLWRQFEFALDIHSTHTPGAPAMLVEVGGDVQTLAANMPLEVIIRNIVQIQKGVPASALYGTPERPCAVVEIEAGYHEDKRAGCVAVESLRCLLANLGMIAAEGFVEQVRKPVYEVFGSVIFPNSTYQLSKRFADFQAIPYGEVLAVGDGEPIRMPENGHALFAPPNGRPTKITDEVMFLTKPVYWD